MTEATNSGRVPDCVGDRSQPSRRRPVPATEPASPSAIYQPARDDEGTATR